MANRRKRPNPWSKINGTGMRRIVILAGIFGVLTFVILFCKLWQLQVTQHDWLENKAITQQTREVTSTAHRGTIYDANGDILAISAAVQSAANSARPPRTDAEAAAGSSAAGSTIRRCIRRFASRISLVATGAVRTIQSFDPSSDTDEAAKTIVHRR